MDINIQSLSDKYYEALGEPKPGGPFGLIDDYRFYIAYRNLLPGSVLDVGVYYGDFLKLLQKEDRRVLGTEINQQRVNLANRILGRDVVYLAFRNGVLNNFKDSSFDNLVCMEVIEHIPDHQTAIRELCRVAKRRVIISVPFEEKIKCELCIHCNNYTPHSGHLHSYGASAFDRLVPPGWKLENQIALARTTTVRLIDLCRIPRRIQFLSLIRLADKLLSGKPQWLMIVLGRAE